METQWNLKFNPYAAMHMVCSDTYLAEILEYV